MQKTLKEMKAIFNLVVLERREMTVYVTVKDRRTHWGGRIRGENFEPFQFNAAYQWAKKIQNRVGGYVLIKLCGLYWNLELENLLQLQTIYDGGEEKK